MRKILNWIILALSLMVLLNCNPYSKYMEVKKETELAIIIKSHRNERGGSILNNTYILPSPCPLIADEKQEHTKPQSKDEFYFAYRSVPYELIKKENEDFFYVIKTGDTLKFKLIDF